MRMNIRPLLFAFALLIGASVSAAGESSTTQFRPDYHRLSSGSFVQDKNFYVLTVMQRNKSVRRELLADPDLAEIMRNSTGAPIGRSALASDQNGSLHLSATLAMFSNEEIERSKAALGRHVARSASLRAVIRDHLRISGAYQRLAGHGDPEMLAEAWAEAARGINRVIEQYALGIDGRYGAIDSASYDVSSVAYQRWILEAYARAVKSTRAPGKALFFEPSLAFALELLSINRRDEAGRHEPLAERENREPMLRMARTDWQAYPYAALLVHGVGPDKPGLAISGSSRENVAAAAALYQKKMAPFIVVSGGYIHPKQTVFSEAIEMKRELMLAHGIPEEAILIEPHARHTTTNIRNTARILFAGRAPAEKASLSVSSKLHIDSIASEKFAERCRRELGYVPATFGARISDVAIEFIPSIDSLHIDPTDPLDP